MNKKWIIAENVDPDLIARWNQLDTSLQGETLANLLSSYLKRDYDKIRIVKGEYWVGDNCRYRSITNPYGLFNGGDIPSFLFSPQDTRIMAPSRGLIKFLMRKPSFVHGDILAICKNDHFWIPSDKPEIAKVCEEIQSQTDIDFRIKINKMEPVFGSSYY